MPTVWAPPTRADLFEWLELVDMGHDGDVYDLALAVAVEGQRARCQVMPYTAPLHAAALRRAARFLATKGMALGTYDAGDFGQGFIPRWDSDVRELEAVYRLGGFA